MKVLRWAVAGASVYSIYKYSIGKKAKGKDVFVDPKKEISKLEGGEPEPAGAAIPAKAKRTRRTKPSAKS